MKTSFLDKSTWKGILAWLATCWVFFLGVFAAELISLDSFKIMPPDRLLEQNDWNGLIWALWGFASDVDSNLKNSVIPSWTVIIYANNGKPCPEGWSQWSWWWKDKFLVPLQPSEWTAVSYWGMSEFVITQENLPRHSHTILYGGYDTQWLSAGTTLAVKNVQDGTTNNWDSDYILKWSSNAANAGKTSERWGQANGSPKPIKFIPEFAKVLFCIKD